jgi:hypothetical protein
VSPDGAHQVPGTGTSGGAGIGGGSFGPGGNITISGGFVWAYSPASSSGRPASPSPYDGDTSDINGDPPAIGGGSVSGGSGDAGSITISGGTVIAVTESRGAAIGGGKRATKGSITISGGTIIALYRPGLGAYGYPNIKNYDESNDGTIGLDTDPFGDRGYGHTTTTVSGTPVIFAYGIQDGDRHNRTESKWDIGRTYRPMHVLMTISDEHPTPASGGTIELKSYPTDWNASGPEPPDGNWKEYDLTIPSGATLHIPKGWELIIDGGDDNKSNTLTIASGGKLINDGTITINGTGQANKSDVKLTIASGGELINNGTIRKNGGTFINNGAFNGNAVEQ